MKNERKEQDQGWRLLVDAPLDGNLNDISGNSKPGLYDLLGSICPITGTPFYVNNGSGEFLYA